MIVSLCFLTVSSFSKENKTVYNLNNPGYVSHKLSVWLKYQNILQKYFL